MVSRVCTGDNVEGKDKDEGPPPVTQCRDSVRVELDEVVMCQGTSHSPLLKEGLAVHHVLADRTGLPSPVRSRRVDLVQALTPVGVPTGDEQRHAVRPYTTTRVSEACSFFPIAAPCSHAFPWRQIRAASNPTQPSKVRRAESQDDAPEPPRSALTPTASPSASHSQPPGPAPWWAGTPHTPSSTPARSSSPWRPARGSRGPSPSRRNRCWGRWARPSRGQRCRGGAKGISSRLRGRRRWLLRC
jgi:hypothetical protein